MPKAKPRRTRQLLLLAVALTAPWLNGCLFVAAGAAVGAGAAGWYYFASPQYQDYPTNFPQTTVAAKAALIDLGYPPPTEELKDDDVKLETRAPDKTKVVVHVKPLASKVPAASPGTHVSINVGALTNDDEACVLIHKAIRKRLGLPDPQPPPSLTPTGMPPAPGQRIVPQAAFGPAAAETNAPPLAPR